MFNAPTQDSSPRITIQATKPGFVAGQNQVTVVISGVPDLTSIKVGGIPLIIFLASFILIAVIMIVAVVSASKNKPPHYHILYSRGATPQPEFRFLFNIRTH